MVLPAAAAWAESEGTVTNSERRVQRVRKALEPPGEARATTSRSSSSSRTGSARDWGEPIRRDASGTRCARSRPVHAGMSYARLEARGRAPVAVLRRDAPGRAVPPQPALGGSGPRRTRAVRARGSRPAGRQARRRLPDPAHDRPPARLVQHRRPDRRGYTVAAAPRRDARHLARRTPRSLRARGRRGRARRSRRGQVEVPVRIDASAPARASRS